MKPDMKNAYVTWSQYGTGQLMYVLFVTTFIAPIGFVWGWPEGNSFMVAGSYVLPTQRRCGVRTRINKIIFEHYEVIRTIEGSKEGGLAFMKASGYRYHAPSKTWYLKRPIKKP